MVTDNGKGRKNDLRDFAAYAQENLKFGRTQPNKNPTFSQKGPQKGSPEKPTKKPGKS